MGSTRYSAEFKHRLHNGTLASKGKAFQFEMSIPCRKEYYTKDINGYRWKKDRRAGKGYVDDLSDNEADFKRALAEFSDGIVCSKEYRYLDDKRESPTGSPYWAEATYGFKSCIQVSDACAHKLYYEYYAKDGLLFRDKLLANYSELLNELRYDSYHYCIIDDYCPSYQEGAVVHPARQGRRFLVSTKGVFDSYPLSSDTVGVYFSGIGMTELANVAECYGMALALIEIMRPNWEKAGELQFQIISHLEDELVAVEVQFWAVTKKHTLRAW